MTNDQTNESEENEERSGCVRRRRSNERARQVDNESAHGQCESVSERLIIWP